jgi:predicted ester cyclase
MSDTTKIEAHKATVERWIEIINSRDFDSLPEVCHLNVVRHCPATPDVAVHNIGDLVAFLKEDLKAVPDSVITSKMEVYEGELGGFWANYSGTQTGQMGPFPPSGKRVDADFSGIFRFEDAKIAEIWVTWDNIDILTQLGHLPPPGAEG